MCAPLCFVGDIQPVNPAGIGGEAQLEVRKVIGSGMEAPGDWLGLGNGGFAWEGSWYSLTHPHLDYSG